MARGQSPFQGRYTVPRVDFSPIERAGGAWGQAFAHLGQTVKQGVEARHELNAQLEGIKGQLKLLKTSPFAKAGGMESKIKELEGQLDSPDLSKRKRVAIGKSALQTIAVLADHGFKSKQQSDLQEYRMATLRAQEADQSRKHPQSLLSPPVTPTTSGPTTPAPSSEAVAPLAERTVHQGGRRGDEAQERKLSRSFASLSPSGAAELIKQYNRDNKLDDATSMLRHLPPNELNPILAELKKGDATSRALAGDIQTFTSQPPLPGNPALLKSLHGLPIDTADPASQPPLPGDPALLKSLHGLPIDTDPASSSDLRERWSKMSEKERAEARERMEEAWEKRRQEALAELNAPTSTPAPSSAEFNKIKEGLKAEHDRYSKDIFEGRELPSEHYGKDEEAGRARVEKLKVAQREAVPSAIRDNETLTEPQKSELYEHIGWDQESWAQKPVVDAPHPRSGTSSDDLSTQQESYAKFPQLTPPAPLTDQETRALSMASSIELNQHTGDLKVLTSARAKQAALRDWPIKLQQHQEARLKYEKDLAAFKRTKMFRARSPEEKANLISAQERDFSSLGLKAQFSVNADGAITFTVQGEDPTYQLATMEIVTRGRMETIILPHVYTREGDSKSVFLLDRSTGKFKKQGDDSNNVDVLVAAQNAIDKDLLEIFNMETNIRNYEAGKGQKDDVITFNDYVRIRGSTENNIKGVWKREDGTAMAVEYELGRAYGEDKDRTVIWDDRNWDDLLALGFTRNSPAAQNIINNREALEAAYERYTNLQTDRAEITDALNKIRQTGGQAQTLFSVGELPGLRAGGAGGEQPTPPIPVKLRRNEQGKIDPEVLEPVVEGILSGGGGQ